MARIGRRRHPGTDEYISLRLEGKSRMEACAAVGMHRETAAKIDREEHFPTSRTPKFKPPEPEPEPKTFDRFVPPDDDREIPDEVPGQVTFPFGEPTPEQLAAGLANIDAPRLEDVESPPRPRPTIVHGERGLTFPGGRSGDGTVPTREIYEGATHPRGYRSPSAKVIDPRTGEVFDGPPGRRQKANPRYDVNPSRRSTKGYWTQGWRDPNE
jgi:hypothetical protein